LWAKLSIRENACVLGESLKKVLTSDIELLKVSIDFVSCKNELDDRMKR